MVPDADRAIRFMLDAFDAEEIRRFDTPEGTVMHAEVRLADSVIMIGQSGGEWPPVPGYLHLYVPDVESVYRRALELGAESLQEPVRKDDDDDLRGGVRDKDGTTWWIATMKNP